MGKVSVAVLILFSLGLLGLTRVQALQIELPVHEVYLEAYFISIDLVTFDVYDTFCNTLGKALPSDNSWGRGARPVINVSWVDAIEYCNWLSEQEGLDMCYDSNSSCDMGV